MMTATKTIRRTNLVVQRTSFVFLNRCLKRVTSRTNIDTTRIAVGENITTGIIVTNVSQYRPGPRDLHFLETSQAFTLLTCYAPANPWQIAVLSSVTLFISARKA